MRDPAAAVTVSRNPKHNGKAHVRIQIEGANLFRVSSQKRLRGAVSSFPLCPCRKEAKKEKPNDSLIARIIENPLKKRDLFDVAQQNGLMVCVCV